MTAFTDIRLFLLDMDGTFYLGNRVLGGSRLFVETVGRLPGVQFAFLTNNSSKSCGDYCEKLAGMGFSIPKEQVLTSGEATARYLSGKKPGARVALFGTPSLEREFRDAGFRLTDREPDFAVLGFDMTMTYGKMARLCDLVRAGVPYIATHPDFNCPVEGGYLPDIGAMIAFVEASAGRRPEVIGKPNRAIIDAASEKFGVPHRNIAMVGDRLYTDIAVGVNAGITSVLVLSGETSRADLVGSEIQPDYIFDDLGGLAGALRPPEGASGGGC